MPGATEGGVGGGSTEVVNIFFRAKGAKTVTRDIQNMGTRSKDTGRAVGRLGGLLATAFSVQTLRLITAYADEYTIIQNRLRVVTKSTRQLEVATKGLLKVANATRSDFGATSELYVRLAQDSRQLGLNQEQLLRITESVNKATILSGASTLEAAGGIRQLTQGLSIGALRGEELRSVMENLRVAADTIAGEMGVTRGELLLLGEQGKITSKIIVNAFLNASDSLDQGFGKTIPTITQAFGVLRNQMVAVIGKFTTATGASKGLALAIIFLAESMETLLRVTLALTAASALGKLPLLLTAVTKAVKLLGLALKGGPLGVFIAVISLLVSFSDKIKLAGEGSSTLFDYLKAGTTVAIKFAKLGLEPIVAILKTLWQTFQFGLKLLVAQFFPSIQSVGDAIKTLLGIFSGVVEVLAQLYENGNKAVNSSKDIFIGFLTGLGAAAVIAIENLPETIKPLLLVALDEIISFTINKIIEGINFITDLLDKLPKFIKDKLGIQNLGKIAEFSFVEDVLGIDITEDRNKVEDYAGKILAAFVDEFDPKLFGGSRTLAQAFIDGQEKGGVGLDGLFSINQLILAEIEYAKIEGNLERQRDLQKELNELAAEQSKLVEFRVDTLNREIDLQRATLTLSESQAKIYEDIFKENEKILELGRELTAEERASLRQAFETRESLTVQRDLYLEINGAAKQYNETIQALIRLYAKGSITRDQFFDQGVTAELNKLSGEKSVVGGAQRGVLRITEDVRDLATLTEDSLVGAFNKVEDAIVDMVMTGKASFKDLAQSILADITKIALRQAITGPIMSALGGAFQQPALVSAIQSGASTSIFPAGPASTGVTAGVIAPATTPLPGFAAGGYLNQPAIVGEHGPELFVPTGMGNVIPNSQLQGGGGNVTINMNVSTPNADSFRKSESQIAQSVQRIGRRF